MKSSGLQDQLPDLRGLRVLVVEGNIDNRYLYTVVLETLGADVMAVASAHEALAAVTELNPHILVSDIVLPDENGYAFIRKLRAVESPLRRPLPALAVSGFLESQARPQALSAGFHRWLSKPIDLDLFVHTILEMVSLDRFRVSA